METNNYSVKSLLMFIFVVLFVIVMFYGITILITKNKKNSTTKETIEEAVIQYEEIVVGEIFSQSEEEYYVLATFKNDTELSNYNSLVTKYNDKEKKLKVYSINLNSGFNKKYISLTSQFVSGYPLFKESTLIKISNKNIDAVYEGQTKIKTQLQLLVDEE